MTTLLSYHNDRKVKAKYLDRVRAHAKADEIVQGKGWEGGKGCAVGCTLHAYSHDRYETELGLPVWLARLEDTIFEGLPNEAAKKFPAQFLSAIPVGKNLEKVRWQFALVLLKENAERVSGLEIDAKMKNQVLDAIEKVAALNRTAIESGEWNESAESSASAAAWSAASASSSAWSAASSASAWSAASSASAWSAASSAESSASSSAWSAESSASSAARSAAWAAESSAESAAARSAAYIRYADELLKLLRAA